MNKQGEQACGCRNHVSPAPLSRRDMLLRCANGFGAVALSALLADRAYGAVSRSGVTPALSHHTARARSVIFLYMDGGVSQVDSVRSEAAAHEGPRQALRHDDGADAVRQQRHPPSAAPGPSSNMARAACRFPSLFPHVARCVDELAMIRSMVSNFSEHNQANYFLHTGHGLVGRPSMGAWTLYGLGTREPEPAGLRGAERRPDSLGRRGQFRQRLPARVLSGFDVQGQRAAGGEHRAPEPRAWQLRAGKLSLLNRLDQRIPSSAWGASMRWRRPSPIMSLPAACRPPRRTWPISKAKRR
jgi:hypothetical protein